MSWEVSLVKRYGSGRAARAAPGFRLEVALQSSARRLALVGPSGIGKTQTLKCIAGTVRPDAGRIAIQGRVLFDSAAGLDLSPPQRRLGVVFQDHALFPHLSARQNIAFACRNGWRNPPRDADDPAVARWIDAFELGAVAGLYPHQLSGGQRQRTALARALVAQPQALLLDEPFAALDRPLRLRLRAELRGLLAGLPLPVLLVTHDEDDVQALADDCVRLGPPVAAIEVPQPMAR